MQRALTWDYAQVKGSVTAVGTTGFEPATPWPPESRFSADLRKERRAILPWSRRHSLFSPVARLQTHNWPTRSLGFTRLRGLNLSSGFFGGRLGCGLFALGRTCLLGCRLGRCRNLGGFLGVLGRRGLLLGVAPGN